MDRGSIIIISNLTVKGDEEDAKTKIAHSKLTELHHHQGQLEPPKAFLQLPSYLVRC
jgi:hypothetical protein